MTLALSALLVPTAAAVADALTGALNSAGAVTGALNNAIVEASVGVDAVTHAVTDGGGGLSLFEAIALGCVQGVTEFLPVSSSGHLALGHALLGHAESPDNLAFNVAVHVGTLVAVLWVYRADLIGLARGVLSRDRAATGAVIGLGVATAWLALALWSPVRAVVDRANGSLAAIGVGLWITAALLWVSRALELRRGEVGRGEVGSGADTRTGEVADTVSCSGSDDVAAAPTSPTLRQAALIGAAQLCALLPGVSRSGSTIAAGVSLGLQRSAAARFSFLLSIPAIIGAASKELLPLVRAGATSTTPAITMAAGAGAAAVTGLVSLRALLWMVEGGRYALFAPYLVVVGALAIWLA